MTLTYYDLTMRLRELFSESVIELDLKSRDKDGVLGELVALLDLDDRSSEKLLGTLRRRERLGSTGIGKGVAIPHCRSLVVKRLHLAYGRKPAGVDFNAIDGAPVHHFFLIIAPPLEVSNQYLPVLGKIAQFAKDPAIPKALGGLDAPADFLTLLEGAP